ncbi:creatininase family protein [Pseudoruegeria sp. HB172150]|uniref:creatininase family protein n=1 Tax=Pseudoruegeria sp. HB172150 TaxID=2721164 RepID=UPI001556DE0F|nr:creatininase family protein [Pseudoruegeria sp. HB172150]
MDQPAKHELARMTYREAEMAFKKNPVILIPMGSTEQHGPQTPTGDFRLANALSLEMARRTGAISAPVIPFSEGAAARDFPGAVALRRETLYNLVWDVCRGFTRFGLDHLMLVSGDHGNVPILENLIRDFKDSEGIRISMVEQYRWFTPEWLEEIYERPNPPIGHGGDPIMSLNLHLFPDDVRSDLIETEIKNDFQGLRATSFTQMTFGKHMFYLPVDYSELSPNGVRGDASIASKEVGEKIFNGLVDKGVEIVERFKQVDTRCEAKPW